MHDEPATPVPRMPADPATSGAPCTPVRHLRLVAGGPPPAEEAMRPLETGELRRVTGRPSNGPAPGLSPAVEPW